MSAWTLQGESVNQFGVRFTRETTTGTYAGRGEFYTGLREGERVKLARETYAHEDGKVSVHYSCALIDGGAWLALGHEAPSVVIDN